MDQYVRVSRVAGRSGESFISPDLQREQGAAWASSRGVEVAAIHEDLDQSGGKLERPGLDALMARIRAGETDGVIVSKLDRLSRLVWPTPCAWSNRSRTREARSRRSTLALTRRRPLASSA